VNAHTVRLVSRNGQALMHLISCAEDLFLKYLSFPSLVEGNVLHRTIFISNMKSKREGILIETKSKDEESLQTRFGPVCGQPLPSEEEIPSKESRAFKRRPRPEFGLDCRVCAILARQRIAAFRIRGQVFQASHQPLSSEKGTIKTIKASFWPWLSVESYCNVSSCSLFTWKRTATLPEGSVHGYLAHVKAPPPRTLQ
jgi:hypothetical protein